MTGRPTILVVDDEYSLLESLTDILELEGYAVVSATNGERALATMELSLPDVVLLDFMMPVMDGLQFLAVLDQRGLLKTLPVILMTAAPNGLPRDPAQRRWTALLTKPFELPDLIETIDRVLKGRGHSPG